MKNGKNSPSEASDERKTGKTARPRGWMNEKQEKLLVRGLG